MTISDFAKEMLKATMWVLVILLVIGIAGGIAPVHALESFAPLYELSSAERAEIERIVMAEAGGECHLGQRAVAQCILSACLRDDLRPLEAVRVYGYTQARKKPTRSVQDAVKAVFDYGALAVDKEIDIFYAPKRVKSDWHESQEFVVEIGNHRFFRMKGD